MFSIIIPSKNEEKEIRSLLQSIREQTLQPAQIVVADKSTDKTRDIARSFGVTVIEGVDDGRVGKARNKGASYAKGDLLFFIDADIKLPTITFLEDAITCFEAMELDLASCYYRPSHKNVMGLLSFGVINLAKKFDSLIKNGFSSGGGFIIIKKAVFEKLGRFNEDFKVSEDLEFMTRGPKLGYHYGVLPLWVDVSSRRFSDTTPLSLIITTIGGVGTIAANVLGITWLRKFRETFEKWYGETGGDTTK